MPLKIIVGLCRKIGQPNYGSASASCSAEVQLDSTLDDLDAFHRAVQDAYAACEKAVNGQLAGKQAGNHGDARPTFSTPDRQNGNGNGTGWRPASEKQMTYVRQLAARIDGLGVRRLDTLAEKICGVPVAALSSLDASRLIDVLKRAQAGEAGLRPVLGEE